jgi:transmembrane sensor
MSWSDIRNIKLRSVKKETQEKFMALLEKYNNGLISPKEKLLLDEWFDVLGEQEINGGTLTEAEKLSLKGRLQRYRNDEQNGIPVRSLQGSSWGTVYKIAASLLLVAITSYLIWQFSGRTVPTSATMVEVASQGNVKKVMLSDGSIIWLKGNSSITYPEKFEGDTREVSLTGEALFEVEKDPAHPFIIQSGDIVTRVLGTSFNIRSTSGGIEVYVLTGKVLVTAKQTQQKIELLPAEKVLYAQATQQLVREEVKEEQPVQYTAGTEYDMNFNRTTLGEIAARVEGKFNVEVTLSDPRLKNCMVTGDFTDQSLERTLNMMSQILGFEYEHDENKIKIRGKGCE